MKSSSTSDRLKQIMADRNLRQVDILKLAEPYCKKFDIKLGKNDLSQYVSGKVEPGQEKLSILGLALGVSETWLMGYDVPVLRNAEQKPTPVSEDGLDQEAKEVAEAYKIADPYVQFSVRKLLALDTQNMEFQFAARKSDKTHPSTGPDTEVEI